jgi:ectoine hydroxylase-related dioxygenase (phytanoyl-CoA dioxygenase family)
VFDREAFVRSIQRDGCAVVRDVLDPDYVRRAKAALERAIDAEVAWHHGKDYPDFGMVLVCPMYDLALTEILGNPRAMEPFEAVLGEGCTVYAYTSSSMPPSGTNYSHRIHVDCPRIIPGYVTNMGATIALDDFTEENGATWYLPGSHERADAPSEQEFFTKAKRFVAPAGSVLYFNARIWHSGGANATPKWRHALTINMCRPWMKQRIDLPRALAGKDFSSLPPKAAQKLGFLAQVPANLDEYYAPPEKRKYRQKTE